MFLHIYLARYLKLCALSESIARVMLLVAYGIEYDHDQGSSGGNRNRYTASLQAAMSKKMMSIEHCGQISIGYQQMKLKTYMILKSVAEGH